MNEETPNQPVDETPEMVSAPTPVVTAGVADTGAAILADERLSEAVTGEEIVAEGPEAEAQMQRLSRRAFLQAGVVTAGVVGGIYAFNRIAPVEATATGAGIKTLFRKGLTAIEPVAHNVYFSETHRAPEFPRERAVTPMNNYHGETPTPDVDAWKLTLEGMGGSNGGKKTLTFADLKALNLQEVSATTELKCVEGWSAIVNWSGWRLRDFMEKFPPPPGTQYVAMRSEAEGFEETWYYVGLDFPSCQHPQSLLATAMNGAPLTAEHGAPLRLIMPHKYGIKNIKLITHIAYAPEKPKDYWFDRGYDYYAGL